MQENLQLFARHDLSLRLRDNEGLLRAVWTQLQRGDFFICLSSKLRDLYLGMLQAMGRINPYTYDQDPTLRELIAVVPFGLPREPPLQYQHGLKGTWPGIGLRDFVVYWGGGIYDWLDPLTAVRAVGLAAARNPNLRLFFPATKHPNPGVHVMASLKATYALSESLGLTGKVVFFNDWVPYERRADFLLDADVGLSLHLDHLETAYSFRTRILDYIWAGLPVVATRGDVLGDMIEARDLGIVVSPGDAEAVAQAFLRLAAMGNPRSYYRERLAALADELSWPRCAEPLMAFCDAPRRAPDRAAGYCLAGGPSEVGYAEQSSGWLRKVMASLRDGGPARLVADIRAYVRWRLGN